MTRQTDTDSSQYFTVHTTPQGEENSSSCNNGTGGSIAEHMLTHYLNWYWKFADLVSVYPTATPTPRAYEYVVATGCVSALLILLLGTMLLLIYLLYYQHRKAEEALYRHEPPPRHEPPLSIPESRTQASISFTSGSSKSTAMTAAQFGSTHGMSAAQFAAAYGGGSQSSLSIKHPTVAHSVV